MTDKLHAYAVNVRWTGNLGSGTSGYRDYSRDHVIAVVGKSDIAGSSDPSFRGDAARWNPEDLLVASLSACHKLWYLSLCANARIVVEAYEDHAAGTMVESAEGGRFTGVTLRPRIRLAAEADEQRARELHHEAHRQCFIANSVNFPVMCEPEFVGQG